LPEEICENVSDCQRLLGSWPINRCQQGKNIPAKSSFIFVFCFKLFFSPAKIKTIAGFVVLSWNIQQFQKVILNIS
jgi:hypothetical protein